MAICAVCKKDTLMVAPDTGMCGECERLLQADGDATTIGDGEEGSQLDRVPAEGWRPSPLLITLVVVAFASAAAWWWFDRQQIAHAYAEALARCDFDSGYGAAQIAALDRLHGIDARPSRLRVSLAICALDSSVQDLQRLRLR